MHSSDRNKTIVATMRQIFLRSSLLRRRLIVAYPRKLRRETRERLCSAINLDRYCIEAGRPALALANISKDAPRISIPWRRMRSGSLQVPGKLSRLQVTIYRSDGERPLAAPIVRSARARETRTRRRRIHNERRRYKISHATGRVF